MLLPFGHRIALTCFIIIALVGHRFSEYVLLTRLILEREELTNPQVSAPWAFPIDTAIEISMGHLQFRKLPLTAFGTLHSYRLQVGQRESCYLPLPLSVLLLLDRTSLKLLALWESRSWLDQSAVVRVCRGDLSV